MTDNPHGLCPAQWCITVSCAECGEMLTNPTANDEGLSGRCLSHGRQAPAILMHREDCLIRDPRDGRNHFVFQEVYNLILDTLIDRYKDLLAVPYENIATELAAVVARDMFPQTREEAR